MLLFRSRKMEILFKKQQSEEPNSVTGNLRRFFRNSDPKQELKMKVIGM